MSTTTSKRKSRKSIFYYFAWIFLGTLGICMLAADFLANESPIWVHDGQSWHFTIYGVPPTLNQPTYEKIHAPIRYSPETLDLQYPSEPPKLLNQNNQSKHKHWLGTDDLGRDILAILIHGSRTSLFIGLLAMVFATINGVLLGGLAGFLGDKYLKVNVAQVLSILAGLGMVYFYGFHIRQYDLADPTIPKWQHIMATSLVLVCSAAASFGLFKLLVRIKHLAKSRYLPFDLAVQRLIEVFTSIPRIFLILSLVVIVSPSLNLFAIIIGLTFWTEVARMVRGEMVRVREYTYIEAAKAIGVPTLLIFMRHALPNVWRMILVSFLFGLASTIMMESTLSFLGAGLPPETVSWGKLLSKFSMINWWKSVFPGTVIFLTILSFHTLAKELGRGHNIKRNKML